MAKNTTPDSLYGNSRDILREAERENEILADIAGEEYESPGDIPKGKYVIEKRLLDAAQKKNELLEAIADGGGAGVGANKLAIDYATDVLSLKKGDTPIANSGVTLPAYGVSFDSTTGGLTLTKNGTAVSGQTVTIPNYGSPVAVTASSGMTDHDLIYLYEGTTGGGYTQGHFYYWDGSAWADGGEYAAATVQTDKTLLVEDRAADAKATGEAVGELKTQINGTGAPITYTQTGGGYIVRDVNSIYLQYYPGDTGNNSVMVINDLPANGISAGSLMRVTVGGASGRYYGVGFSASAITGTVTTLLSAVPIESTESIQTLTFKVPNGASAMCICTRKPVLETPIIEILNSGILHDVSELELEMSAVKDCPHNIEALFDMVDWATSNTIIDKPYDTRALFTNTTRRIFSNELTGIIRSFSVYAVLGATSYNAVLELWEKDEGKLYLRNSHTLTIPSGESGVIKRIKTSFSDLIQGHYHFAIRVPSAPPSNTGIVLRYNVGSTYYYINNVSDTVLNFSDLVTADNYFLPVEYEQITGTFSLGENVIVVDASGNGSYTSIQNAIDNCGDSPNHPVTLLIAPGIYDRFSFVQSGNDVNDITKSSNWSSTHKMRYISIVGLDRDNTIILDQSGEYCTPAAEILTRGIIRNITFISNHSNPPAETNKPYSYAVHMDFVPVGHPINPGDTLSLDYVPQHVRFENCKFVSSQNAAVGIGLHQDEFIEFNNCEFYSDTPDSGDYSSYVDNGAFLTHNYLHVSGITGQTLIIDNCTMHAVNADYGTVISYSYNSEDVPFTFGLTLTAKRTISVSESGDPISFASQFSSSIGITTFGNNFTLS